MEEFKKYLGNHGYTQKTAQEKAADASHYLAWVQAHHIPVDQVRYADLMDYVGHLQSEGKPVHHQNRKLRAIEMYHSFNQLPAVVQGLRVKRHQTVLKPVLESVELEIVYQHYPPHRLLDQLMLSLVIWQALEPKDIERIELEDVNLSKGQLYIKSRNQRQARYVKLEAHQIMQLYEYITATKVKREQANHERLIVPLTHAKDSLHSTWRRLNKEVTHPSGSQLNISVRSLQHLRQSRLAHWVNQYGLRQAQYLAGFKSVKGMEYYQTQSLKDLQQQLEQCHPLK